MICRCHSPFMVFHSMPTVSGVPEDLSLEGELAVVRSEQKHGYREQGVVHFEGDV